MLDTVMAEALVWDLKVPMSVEEAKQKVTESYTVYRNGGEIFIVITALIRQICFMLITRESRLKKLRPTTTCWKNRKGSGRTIHFTASDRYASEKILKHIGLYDFSKTDFILLKISAFTKK